MVSHIRHRGYDRVQIVLHKDLIGSLERVLMMGARDEMAPVLREIQATVKPSFLEDSSVRRCPRFPQQAIAVDIYSTRAYTDGRWVNIL
jgi:hypothetical protein